MDDQQRARDYLQAAWVEAGWTPEAAAVLASGDDTWITVQLSAITAALRAAPECPEGFVMVPVACTRAMREAWDAAPDSEDDDVAFNGAYAAMIAARPQGVKDV